MIYCSFCVIKPASFCPGMQYRVIIILLFIKSLQWFEYTVVLYSNHFIHSYYYYVLYCIINMSGKTGSYLPVPDCIGSTWNNIIYIKVAWNLASRTRLAGLCLLSRWRHAYSNHRGCKDAVMCAKGLAEITIIYHSQCVCAMKSVNAFQCCCIPQKIFRIRAPRGS